MDQRRIAVFVGTRPEAIKMAPVIKAMRETRDLQPVFVSTGQHREMLAQVCDVFDLRPDFDLGVMEPNQPLALLSARLLERIDGVLSEVRPDFALVQGDTTSVLMAALACFYRRIPIGHVEAGLRTGNISSPFPEELNRTLVTPIAGIHFAPTQAARRNLLAAGVEDSKIVVCGNTVIDALLIEVQAQRRPEVAGEIEAALVPILGDRWKARSFTLVTGHRRENFGSGFEQICAAICDVARQFPDHHFVYPVHLNPNVLGPVRLLLGGVPNVHLIPPQPYRSFVALMGACRLILTDSGGVQEEAPSLGKPVLVMRNTTERPEGVEAGTARLVGANREGIKSALVQLLTDENLYQEMATARNPYGDGLAAERIVASLRQLMTGGTG